jgi:hypothetical protein
MKEGSFVNKEDLTFDLATKKIAQKVETDAREPASNPGNGYSTDHLRNQLEEKDKIILSLRQTIEVIKYFFT